MEKLQGMKLAIFGAVTLALGLWAAVAWWWLLAEVLQGLLTLVLIVGGTLALAIAARKMSREDTPAE